MKSYITGNNYLDYNNTGNNYLDYNNTGNNYLGYNNTGNNYLGYNNTGNNYLGYSYYYLGYNTVIYNTGSNCAADDYGVLYKINAHFFNPVNCC